MRLEPENDLNFRSATRVAERNADGVVVPYTDDETVSSIEFNVPVNPELIGRYRVLRTLGDGGFGRVYLAYDDALTRNVAIKIPHRHLVSKPADMDTYLKEARIVSGLDHNSIVPVYDCGNTEDGRCYVVSKYIDGSDLKTKLKSSPFAIAAAADLVATLADALHFAHVRGIVHRDVKPANILIDSQGRPYLADFGLALREQDFGTGHEKAGTIAYMSPEQIRGEGHLVDGRSDVFSIGLVLYELITGKRPFPSNRLQHCGTMIEPRPPRQIDDSIPRELERICLKALSHRVVDRHNTASDLASDLRAFLQAGSANLVPPQRVPGLSGPSNNTTSGHNVSDAEIHIVPKGLRSFDRDDAGFFLELLPGPRGRDGLPESVRFWKKRILSPESESFRVGVIYGPSGCGKSSFLKAAVLPQLSHEIIPVYIESTPLETETRLLKALRKTFPDLPSDQGLSETMIILRRQQRGASGQRLLIVLDQFEQWLHAKPQGDSGELLKALRQCDGINLQCLITVRDDFWMAVTHFMDELEVMLVPGDNLAVIDLFNIRHARRVLTAIGQAFRVLSANHDEITKEQKAFIEKAIADLANNGQVIPVQLALFAEMVKDKEWTIATLKSLGGTEGVGVTFLEETFNGRTANPHHRLNQKGARAVLRALLPEGETGIKGTMRSYQELLVASGYGERPQDFDPLLRILDSELRLITPTDPEGLENDSVQPDSSSHTRERFYHLTHDYLVPSLQEWLTRKRKETRRGRTELILADRDSVWSKHPSSRSLPSFVEWLSILLFAGRRARQESRRMLNAATRYYGGRAIAGCSLLALGAWGVLQSVHQARAMSIVDSLPSSKCQGVPKLIDMLEPYRSVADRHLQKLFQSSESPATRLNAAMTLLKVDPTKQATVYEGMLSASPDDFATIRDVLMKWGDRTAITKNLWNELLDPKNKPDRRFHAGLSLASFDTPEGGSDLGGWRASSEFLANKLVAEIGVNLGNFGQWVSALRPARSVLYADLHRIFSNHERPEIDNYAAATVLADFATGQPDKLVNLVSLARPREYALLMTKLKDAGDDGKNALLTEFAVTAPEDATVSTRNQFAKRKAHAAVALLEFELTHPLMCALSTCEDATLCTYAEDRLSQLGAQPDSLFRLMNHAESNLEAALLRSLGGIPIDRFAPDLRESVLRTVKQLFQTDVDAGVHSAAEWALRNWGQKEQLAQLTKDLESDGPVGQKRWYINHHGQTMVVFKGPVESRMGSPHDEVARDSDEEFLTRPINRDFAICSKEITVEQFLDFLPDFRHGRKMEYTPAPDCPIVYLTWFRAAEYCNWLSQKEGIPESQWCYLKQRRFTKTNLRPEGEWMDTWQPQKGFLTLLGYRLATEAEWEYACRAGSVAPYFWGSDPDMAPRFARTIINSLGVSSPVGSYCPNRFGLFDMHGNASEWIHDRYIDGIKEPRFSMGNEEDEVLDDTQCVVRGGNAAELISYQRSANRAYAKARDGVSPRMGFRIARTISPEAFHP